MEARNKNFFVLSTSQDEGMTPKTIGIPQKLVKLTDK